jgi:FkbM family methyltransferase
MALATKRLKLGTVTGDGKELAKTLHPAVALQKARYRLDWVLFARGVEVTPREDLIRLGSDYGGWVVPADLVDASWTCYSGGVGEDISFDLELIDRFGCEVFAFDPVPRSAEYAERAGAGVELFRFLPYGVWSEDASIRFFAPRDDDHVSHSIHNLQGTEDGFEASCRSIPSLMRELGHERVELLKLDIEGAEFPVLESIDLRELGVQVLCVEFHRVSTVAAMVAAVERLRGEGYVPVHLHRSDLTLVREDLVPVR